MPNDLASEADLDAELKRLDDLEGWEVVEGWNLPAARAELGTSNVSKSP